MNERFKSLDVLRGLNMFMLTVFTAWLIEFCHVVPGLDWLQPQFHHNPFGSNTLTIHDWIMPLFLFCSGTAIPFAFAKYEAQGRSKAWIYGRILRRVAVLWIMGMICQGNLLKYDWARLKWFSNTLQSIAVGYAFSALFFLHFKPRTQLVIAAALLVGYWALLMFVRTPDGFGGGDFGQHNLCEWVDRVVLGRHCDHAVIGEDGGFYFKEAKYTWLLSSLNFIVTVMTGMFAGELLKERRGTGTAKTAMLLVLGAAMFAAGKLWSLQMPLNKYIWTSSMTLVTSGIAFLLLGVIYWMVDCRKWKGLDWVLPFGLNAIFIYFIGFICDFHSVTDHLTAGLKPYIADPHWFGLLRATVHGLLVWGLLYLMMRKKVFLRV